MAAQRLGWCERCKDNSVRVKIYKDGRRAEICTNHGHGFIQYLPQLKGVGFEKDNSASSQLHFGFCDRPKGGESARLFIAN
jgi:hypothetical protein